jgi:hypothetical protein
MRLFVTVVVLALAVLWANATHINQKPTLQPNLHHVSAYEVTHAHILQQVKEVCDKAHAEISAASEQACGDAQDATGSEYLCDSFGPTANCWVEHL